MPLVFNNKINGFIGFGQKKSGELFGPEDIDLLTALTMQTSVAIEKNWLSFSTTSSGSLPSE